MISKGSSVSIDNQEIKSHGLDGVVVKVSRSRNIAQVKLTTGKTVSVRFKSLWVNPKKDDEGTPILKSKPSNLKTFFTLVIENEADIERIKNREYDQISSDAFSNIRPMIGADIDDLSKRNHDDLSEAFDDRFKIAVWDNEKVFILERSINCTAI